ncbi:Hypothetical predicted protein [Paramuricea clavata]|uniref:Uncharacterized protein n=1 Tax=Paramuricea clavata TaxID=317549 RepID=A0A6S7K2G4_PARCT|nr:Hypothetical predicted protein [Paramuricea clavata]
MEPSTADEDLTVTNVNFGAEYVSENPLDNATEINENGQNIPYSENTILIEADVNTGGDVNGIETASTSDKPRRNAKPSGKSIENTSQIEHTKLYKAWTKVQRAITALQNAPSSIDKIVKAIAQVPVRAEYNAYDNLHHIFASFLTYVGTRECMEELHKLDTLTQVNKKFVSENIEQGNQRKQEVISAGKSSRRSSCSNKKAEIYKKRSLAKTQSALAIQREEFVLAKRKLDEQTRLEALRLEGDAAIAVARAEAIDDELGFDISHEQNPIDLPIENPQTRVQQFIDNQYLHPQTNDPEPTSRDTGNTQQTPSHHLNPMVQPFAPKNCPTATNSDQNIMRSCLEFMVRREILTKRVEKFDDDPQNFHTWKTSFKTMLKDISITPQEELSLLTEYTSKESKKFVQKLRNAYIQNPAKGVVEVWNKLGESFGSDVCAKDDGQQKGLRILDEPIFLRPIIEKLPNDFQSRWQRHALRYKREKHTDYPPFSEFSKFVQDVSLERYDPNLVIEHPTNDDPLCSKPRQTNKTDMKKSDHDDDFRDVTQYNPNNCVLHDMPHPPTHVVSRLPRKVDRRTEKSRKKTPPLFSVPRLSLSHGQGLQIPCEMLGMR